MPKIEIDKKELDNLLLKKISIEELEDLLQTAKAELKEITNEGILKIDLNDTNRPDLWTTAGIARHINQFLKLKKYQYDFFNKRAFNKIIVDPKLNNIRPYITGFIVKNLKINEPLLLELIQSQEKFSINFGHKRKDIAIGIYKSKRIEFPIFYKAVKPEEIKFVPLDFDEELNLNEILSRHPKGIEFGHLVKDFEYYPVIVDSKNEVLSFPPIINSKKLGQVEIGDDEIFIEMTGTNLKNLMLISNIFACDLFDRGAEIIPVEVEYPSKKKIKIPHDFKESIKVNIKEVEKLAGEKFKKNEIKLNLEKMGYNSVKFDNNRFYVLIPNYRQDIMHPVDVIEDLIIGKGYSNFKLQMPEEFTIGKLDKKEILSDKVRTILIGMGFQEIISNILNSKENIYYKMSQPEGSAIEILNPMTESYNLLRNLIIPSLLEVESVSGKAEYPHKIFEVGEIVKPDLTKNYGSKTLINLGLLSANPKANFSEMRSYINTLLYYLAIEDFKIEPADFPFLIQGRSASIIIKNKDAGFIGEIHPEILLKWDINIPTVAAEINLDTILEALQL